MNHTPKIKEFEKEMAFCLNEYWYNLSPLVKDRYITQIHTQAKEEGHSEGYTKGRVVCLEQHRGKPREGTLRLIQEAKVEERGLLKGKVFDILEGNESKEMQHMRIIQVFGK